ncbi:hypothetical protein L9G74_19015 [Shewanella sp. C32]|uniref:Uncharacterized protein n=1 Tax=Shewanella electrica TaxID=515560 RepID=A0ABT2FR49_9GAMM|nr:hypothetical protein [Shewanella electrica]MCS4558531.1 hypothetical protein [Shewanella electrica]
MQTLQTNNATLATTITAQEVEKRRLEQQLQHLAKVNDDYQQQAKVQQAKAQELLTAIEQLRTSQHEQTQQWAISAVPDDVKRMLQHAAYCAVRANRNLSACQDPAATVGRMRNTAL